MLPWILREASILFSLGFCIRIVDIISNHFGEHFKGRIIFLKITEYFVFSIYQRRSPSYSCRSSHLILRRCSRRFLAILPKARGAYSKACERVEKNALISGYTGVTPFCPASATLRMPPFEHLQWNSMKWDCWLHERLEIGYSTRFIDYHKRTGLLHKILCEAVLFA